MGENASGAVTGTRRIDEDWLAAWIGLAIVALALVQLAGIDLLGWAVTTAMWTDPRGALAPAGEAFAAWGGLGALFATYLGLLAAMCVAARALGLGLKRFAAAFTVVFAISYAAWFVGNHAHFAAVTPAELEKFGISWSFKLTNEGGYIVALIAGLVIANVFPRFAAWLNDAIRPELYVKIAIVVLGAFLAVTVVGKVSLAGSLLLRGVAAIIEAYLIYWAVVYYVARKWFGFNREWAVPLASGISICGVSAAIATGSAIRARPVVPVLVSSLVVIFAVVEVLVLPFIAQTFLSDEPMVAAAWMGLAVKTDGAAVAAGGIAEALILSKAAAQGVYYEPGWLIGTTTTVKVFIDVFIGVWAFVLAFIWTNYINVAEGGDKAKVGEIWQRFPKFIVGFVIAFAACFIIAAAAGPETRAVLTPAVGEANTFRVIFFILTFFSIGALSNFRKLWEDGFAKLAAVYFVCLFGFVIWVGFVISWLFFHGVKPPLAS
jgi:uncharacterized membrane protein YadS